MSWQTLVATHATAALVAAGGTLWTLGDYYASRADLRAAQAALAAAERTAAALRASVAIERARRDAAIAGQAALQAVNDQAAARNEALEDLIDEIYAAEGGDAPAPDLLLDAIRGDVRAGTRAAGSAAP